MKEKKKTLSSEIKIKKKKVRDIKEERGRDFITVKLKKTLYLQYVTRQSIE